MIKESNICIEGKYHGPIDSLTGVPTPGKKIMVDDNPLIIRCCLRYVDVEKDIKNLYID